MNELPTPYNIFWRELRPALLAAQATTAKYLAAIKRLKEGVERESDRGNPGPTGYLNGEFDGVPVDPYKAVQDYVNHVVFGAPRPDWLALAEDGHL